MSIYPVPGGVGRGGSRGTPPGHPRARGHASVWGRKHRKIHCLEDFPPPRAPPLPGSPGAKNPPFSPLFTPTPLPPPTPWGTGVRGGARGCAGGCADAREVIVYYYELG